MHTKLIQHKHPLFSQPESIHGEIVTKLRDMPWSDLLLELSSMFENKVCYNYDMVTRAGVRVVKTWGDATTLQSRKAALKQMKANRDHKEVQSTLIENCANSKHYIIQLHFCYVN